MSSPQPWSVLFNGQAQTIKHPWRRRMLFGAFLSTRATLRWLPMPAAQVLGRCLGAGGYLALRRHRAMAVANLRYALGPAASPRTCRDIARGMFVNLGKIGLEWCVLDRYTPEQIRRAVEVRGAAHLRQALARGRGVIAVSAHFGNWEVLPMAVVAAGFEGSVLARRLRYPEYEQFLTTLRQRKGVSTLARGSVTEAVRVLKANQILGVVPDQDIDSLEGVFVDFFGHPTYTPSGPAALSLMTGAPIVPCLVVRSGRRFRVVIEEPIPLPQSGDRAQDILQITQHWSRVIESYVRAYPDQWAWVHPRWKTRPSSDHRSETTDARQRASDGRSPTGPRAHPALHAIASLLLFTVAGGPFTLLSGCSKSSAPAARTPPAPSPTVSASPLAVAPSGGEAAPLEPDAGANQHLDHFAMAGYAADGTKKWDLNGRDAVVDGTAITVKQPLAMGYGVPQDLDPMTTLPKQATLQASLAEVQQTTRRIRMEHEVSIHTSDGLWLFTPILYWIPDESRLTTEQAVRIETDHMLLRGYGGSGHTQLKQAVIQRDVDMVLNPSNHDVAGGNSHVEISCDGPLSFDYEHSVATFEDNVHVKDDQGDLYSDKLIAHLDQATRTVRYAEAIGHVRILQHGNTATGERAVYQPTIGKVTLLGAPALVIEDTQHAFVPSSLVPGHLPIDVPAPAAKAPPPPTPGGTPEAMAQALGAVERSPGVVAAEPQK